MSCSLHQGELSWLCDVYTCVVSVIKDLLHHDILDLLHCDILDLLHCDVLDLLHCDVLDLLHCDVLDLLHHDILDLLGLYQYIFWARQRKIADNT